MVRKLYGICFATRMLPKFMIDKNEEPIQDPYMLGSFHAMTGTSPRDFDEELDPTWDPVFSSEKLRDEYYEKVVKKTNARKTYKDKQLTKYWHKFDAEVEVDILTVKRLS